MEDLLAEAEKTRASNAPAKKPAAKEIAASERPFSLETSFALVIVSVTLFRLHTAHLHECSCDGESSDSAILLSVPLHERKLFVVKLRLREGEKIQDAVKRFRKLVEHAGIKKEMRRREYYEKPSDSDRRNRRRAERRARLSSLQSK